MRVLVSAAYPGLIAAIRRAGHEPVVFDPPVLEPIEETRKMVRTEILGTFSPPPKERP